MQNRLDEPYKCAGCGKEAIGNLKPCGCLTGVGYRGEGQEMEQIWFRLPGEPELKHKIDRVREMVAAGINIRGADPAANEVAKAAFESCIRYIDELEGTLKAEAALQALPQEGWRTDTASIGKEMLRLRTVRKMGLRAMARELGVSPATLSRIENGHEPDLKTARAILLHAGACACCGQPAPPSIGGEP